MAYTVLAIIEAKQGFEKSVKEALQELILPTSKEEGCINYDFHQSLDNPALFMFYENWTNKASHQQHDQSSHIHTAREKIQSIVSRVEVTFWEKT